jgi:hypothetical protein
VSKTELLETWKARCNTVQSGHYLAAAEFQRRHSWLGVPVVIFSTIVGSSILASIDKNVMPVWMSVVTGVMSIGAAALSAAQTFLRYGERAEKHRQSGVAYSALKREIEQMIEYPDADIKQCVNDIRKRWDALNADCPTIPTKFLDV